MLLQTHWLYILCVGVKGVCGWGDGLLGGILLVIVF